MIFMEIPVANTIKNLRITRYERNLRIVKICAYCKQGFIARKTTTQTCSDPCALYPPAGCI